MTLRTRYASATAALIGSVVFFTVGLISHGQRGVLMRDAERRVDILSESVLRMAQESVHANDELMLYSYILALRQEHPELAFVSVRRGSRSTKIVGEESPGLMLVEKSAQAHGGKVELLQLRLGFVRSMIDEEVSRALRPMLAFDLGVGALFMGAGILVALYVVRRLTHPLVVLSKAAAVVGKGNMEVRVPESSEDELGALGRQFNRMTASLRDLMRFREDVLHTLTHELNTPLAGLKGYLELWQDGKLGAGLDGQAEALSTMTTAVARMESSLASALLMFRAEEHERHPERNRLVWVNEVVNEQVSLFSAVAQSKRLTLRALPEEEMGCIYAEEDLLRQAVTNVLSNAVKYTPEGGEIRLGLKSGPEDLTLSISDSGPGIAPEAQKSIFEKFDRSGVGRRSQAFGTGLGLNIAKRAVEAVGGSIRLESAVGRGTTFYLSFPKHVRQGAAVAA